MSDIIPTHFLCDEPCQAHYTDCPCRAQFNFDEFVNGYIEAILWADCLPFCESDGWHDAESGGREHLDVSSETRQAIIERGQLREFVADNLDDLLQYVAACNSGVRVPYDASQGSPESFAGHDFYLTRAGHGAGFWNRDLGSLGDRLTEAAKAAGSVDDHMLFDCGDGTASL